MKTGQATWAHVSMVVLLSIILASCSLRPQALSPDAARVLQTRQIDAGVDDVAKAVVVVFQEMNFQLKSSDLGLGTLTAERVTEFRVYPISKEHPVTPEISEEVQTFCLVAGTLAVIGIILSIIFSDDEDEEQDDKQDGEQEKEKKKRVKVKRHRPHRHHPTRSISLGPGDRGPDSFQYSMTVMLEELSSGATKVRVSLQGVHQDGGTVAASGPVHDAAFYEEFYARLYRVLNL